VLEGGMTKEDQKRNEIFFNEVLAKDEIDRLEDPKAFVNWKRYTAKGEEKVKEIKRDKDGTIKENLIIKGNNLLALHSLKEQFTGKVKLIYIDPPYYFLNEKQGDSFAYNSNFKLSTWLTFMRNRLALAQELLTNDGAIFVQINDDGQGYLKTLMNQLFKPENKLSDIIVKVKNMAGVAGGGEEISLRDLAETILVYAKDKSSFSGFKNTEFWEEIEEEELDSLKVIYSLGKIKKTINISEKVLKIRNEIKIKKIKDIVKEGLSYEDIFKKYDGRIFKETFKNQSSIRDIVIKNSNPSDELVEVEYIPGSGQFKNKKISVYYTGNIKRFVGAIDHKIKKDGKKYYYRKNLGNLWDDISWNGIGNEGGVSLNNGKKPEKLLHRIIDTTTNESDIVLDYHAGSGTTLAIAHKTGRQYIGIEQLDYGENNPETRLKNVINGDQSGISKSVNWKGGGDFIYLELAKWNEEAKEKILKAKNLEELEKLFDELYERYFLNYNVKTKEFKEKTLKEEGFKKLSLDEQKKLFVEMLDMNQMYVNFSERADKKYNLSKDDIVLSEEFYNEKK
jgi:adenine-specific DNA-methyltransferase